MKRKRLLNATTWSTILLSAVAFASFFVPLFPLEWNKYMYRGLFTIIYFAGVFCLERYQTVVLRTSIALIILQWIAEALNMQSVNDFSQLMTILFFLFIVGALIRQIAAAKQVSPRVILEAINGYLLVGLVFGMILTIITFYDPSAYTFKMLNGPGITITSYSERLYYAFITMTTVGYGDIVPLKPYARSFATLIAISGQLYIAIIIALLVGKFSAQK